MEILLYILGAFVAYLILLRFISHERKFKKRFNKPKTKYSALTDSDDVHISGRTKLIASLNTPILGSKCCYFKTTVFEVNRYGEGDIIKKDSDWSELKSEVGSSDFILEVNLQPVLILTASSEALVKTNIDTHSEQLLDTSEFENYWLNIKAMLERDGVRVCNVYDKFGKRVKESFVGNDEPLSVVGKGSWRPVIDFPEIQNIIESEQIYVVRGSEKKPLVFTNSNSLLWG